MLTKLIGALAGVMLAGNAWALNAPSTADELQAAYNVCREVNSMNLCTMKHAASEAEALAWATQTLEICKSDDPSDYIGGIDSQCLAERAYIKQRWGY